MGRKLGLFLRRKYRRCKEGFLRYRREHYIIRKTAFKTTLGTEDIVRQYVSKQASEWAEQVVRLAKIAASQPQCAYAAFRRSLSSRWTYLARTVPNISDVLSPVESAIPALTGQPLPGDLERELFALPTCLGGLGLANPMEVGDDQYAASQKITAPINCSDRPTAR